MMLRNNQTTERRFIDEQRRLILRRQLAGTVLNGTQLPKAAMEAAERYQNEQRTVEYVAARARAGRRNPGADARAAREVSSRSARRCSARPEYRKIVMLPLLPGEQAMWTQISDADVQNAYEERRARYLTPERRTLQQIVFDNPQEAQAAAERIAKGESFLDIAKERKLTEKEIDLGTLTKSAIIDQAVADAAFALKEDEVSAPVKGRFGTVLVRVAQDRAGAGPAVRRGPRRAPTRSRERARPRRDPAALRQDRGRALDRPAAGGSRGQSEARGADHRGRPARASARPASR